MPDSDITEVTQPVDFAIIEDRLHFTLTSGSRKRTYAITFHKARGAAHEVGVLLDERDRDGCDIRQFKRKR
jgi:hypothetical protein